MSESDFYTPGWVDDQEAVTEIATSLEFPFWGLTPAAQVSMGALPDHVFTWEVYEKITGKPWPSRNQGKVGSCVSFGTSAAIEGVMSHEILRGEPEAMMDLCQEVCYAGSRVEIGKNKIRPSSDGSIGAWAAEFSKQWGVIDRGIYGKHDLTQYNQERCRAWGGTGVPDDLEPEVRKHPVKEVTLVRNWDSFKQALGQGYCVSICSSQGFSMTRDRDGHASPRGVWQHCMAGLGYKTGRREGAWICNSWGPDAHTGPVGEGNPPTCGFWADADVVDKMLRQGDSWAFSGVQGFPARVINWMI